MQVAGRMDATQAICDSDFYGDDEEEEENNDETNGVPVARLKLFKNNHLPETELPLYQGENVVGRDPSSCTVLLPARSMSKQHAIISISLFRDSRRGDIAMEALIWDLGSMNGTRKGRIKLTPHIRYALSEGEGLVLADLPCQYAGSKEKGTESDRTVENQAKEISTVEMSDSSDKSISLEQKEQSSVHIVPETDSDFDGKQGAFFCKYNPLSEMEETTTTGAAKPGPLEFNLDSDTDVEGGQDEVEAEVSQPRATNSKPGVSSTEGAAKPAERHMDSDTDVDEDVADGGSEKEPIDSGASNKAAEFHMDSDTDVEDESAESVQVHQHPDEFHMDSDTDAEDESKTVSNPVVTSYQTKEVTASDRVNQPPEEFRMDSDTDAEDESKTVSNPVVTSDQIKEVTGSDRVNQPPAEFHMDSDTDAEDDSKTVSNPVVTSDQIKEVTASDRVNQPPAEFHMDSDTDAEDDSKTVSNPVVTSDQIKEVTGSDRVNQPPAEFHMDSDTDAEDESKTVSNPVVTSDQIKEVTGSDRVNQPPAEFHMDSGTDAEEVDDVPPSKVETTQAEVKSDHQMMILMEPDSDSGENTDEDPFKPSKSKTSKTVPLQESAGEAELKIQSDSDTEDARQLLNPPAKQGASEAAGRPEESRSPARQPADLLCLTDRSNIQAMAAENTQAFSLPEERASDEVDSDLEATQAYGAASEQGGSGQAVEATQEYITHSDVDVEEVDKTPALDIIAAVMEKSEDEATQPTEYDPDYLLSTADTEIIHRSVQMEDKSEHNSDDYVGQEAKLCERSNDSDKEQVINSTESHLDVNFATSETQPICNTDDDYFEKAAKAESPKQRYRPLKGRRKREKAQPFQSFSDPQLSTAQTQPMSLFEEENGEEEGTLSLSEVSRRGGDKEAQEGPSTKPLEPSKRRGGKINDENNGEGEDENARILEPTRGKGPASKRGGRRRGRVVPEVEDELKDVFSRGKRKKRVMGLEREQDKQIANEGREILEENKCNQRLEKEKKEKEEREKVRGERTKQEEREREKKEREECLERERKEKEAKERMAMERKEKEERERIQRERKEQEEREREKKEREECLERERKEKEAKDRMAMERKEKEERERIQRERKEQEEREREKKEREEHLEREKKEKEAKEQMAMERKEKEEREIIQRERKEQEEREREKKEREECLERERKEKEAKDQMDMERKEKKRLEWEKKEREEQEKQNILVSQRLEKERIEKAKTEEQERLEREEKKQECLEHEREESERIEKKTQKTKEDEKLESPEERKTTIEEEKPQDEGLQKEETKTKPRGRRASNRRTAPVASSGLQDRLPSSDDGPARRTRSRSSSSNSVSSERSTSSLQSLGRGRGQRTLEPATGRRSTRRTVVSSDADKDPVSRRTSRSNSSNSVSSGISTASNELQNKGRGRGRGRKSVKGTSELKSEAEPSSSLGQAGEPVSPKVTGRRRRPRKTTGDDDSLDNDSTQTNNEKYFSNKPVDTPRTKSASKKNKLDVLFTGVTDEAGEAVVAHLGGSIAKGVCDMTHLVTDGVRRTVKFMCAVAKGIPVVNPDWLKKCGKEGSFMPADNFLVKDAVQEKKFNFCLKESLRMASQKPLLEGYEIHVTRSVKPEPSQMKDIITCSGARYLPKMPSVNKPQTVVVSCLEDSSLCPPALSASVPVVTSEFLLTGILQQKVDLVSHALAIPAAPAKGRKK
uniref:Mediator of DNA damage checkpoint protein 1 n=1 Tax=Denticeps clupeoides TaxID=299321 RepID=A0AAY4A2Y1_9TELE